MPFNVLSATQAAQRAQQSLAANRSTATQQWSSESPKYGFSISLVTRDQYNAATGASHFNVGGTTISLGGIGGGTGAGSVVGGSGIGAFGGPASPPAGGGNIGQTVNKGTNVGSVWLPLPNEQGMVDNQQIDYATIPVGTELASKIPVVGGLVNPVIDITSALGVPPNQFYTVILKGPTYKTYSLTFDLAPRTAGDSENIRKVILTLRRAAAPGLLNLFIWKFPMIALCTYVPQGNEAQTTYMYAFKPAVMTSVAAQYMPNGTAFYKQGAPESVRLQLQFMELEYWLDTDYGAISAANQVDPKTAGAGNPAADPPRSEVNNPSQNGSIGGAVPVQAPSPRTGGAIPVSPDPAKPDTRF